jgi:hypothetical protein
MSCKTFALVIAILAGIGFLVIGGRVLKLEKRAKLEDKVHATELANECLREFGGVFTEASSVLKVQGFRLRVQRMQRLGWELSEFDVYGDQLRCSLTFTNGNETLTRNFMFDP